MKILKKTFGQTAFGIMLLCALRVNGTDMATKISQMPIFERSIVWCTASPPSDEVAAPLLEVLDSLSGKGPANATQVLEAFIQQNPNSPWTPSLRSLLGKYYRDTGRYSLALQHWQQAWDETKDTPSGNAKNVADYTFAHWTRFLGCLGRKEKLLALFKATEGRIFDRGPLDRER